MGAIENLFIEKKKLKDYKTFSSKKVAPAIEAENAILSKKLDAIVKKKPPVPPTPKKIDWKFKFKMKEIRKTRQIERENKKLAKELDKLYQVRSDSYVVKNGYGKGVDCRPLWKKRTDIYRNGKLGSSANCIPKTLGSIRCKGCGVESFYRADGGKQTVCSKCEQVYYCSEDCMLVDLDNHKFLCDSICKGETIPLKRPDGFSWLTSAAMGKGLRLIHSKNRFHKDVGMTGEQIAELVRKERVDELKKEAAELKKKKPQP